MKLHIKLLTLALAGIFFGCATMTINSDFDKESNFSELKTYNWLPEPKIESGDPRLDSDTLISQRVVSNVEKQLNAKGYTKAEENPDFKLGYHVSLKNKMDVAYINQYYRYAPGWGWDYAAGPGGPQAQVYTYEEGSLIIDVVDPQSNQLMWRGWAEAEVDESPSPEKRDKKIAEAVEKILAEFPPK